MEKYLKIRKHMYTSVKNATRTTSRHAYDILEGKTCMQIM